MRIKEVETATGLTAKAIRLYESKGLLQVSRESENDYRDYTQEDVERLKTISVLRELNVSIREIKQWADGQRDMTTILRDVQTFTLEETKTSNLRRDLAQSLINALEADPNAHIPELMEDAKQFREIMQELKEQTAKRHLLTPVYLSVMSIGPIGGTILNIHIGGEKDLLVVGLVLSVISSVVAAFSWFSYFSAPKENRERSGCLTMLLSAVGLFAGIVALIAMSGYLQTKLFVPDERMIFVSRWQGYVLLFALVMGFAVIVKFRLWQMLKDWKPVKAIGTVTAVVLVGIMMIYGSVTAVSVASEEGITRYGFFCPQGKFYTYDQIVSVETGFGGKFLGLPARWTGEFYYRVTFEDGTVMNWGDSQSDWDEVSWEWMLRLDQWIMDAGATKEGSDEYWQYVEMDDIYVQILRRVIQNRGGE